MIEMSEKKISGVSIRLHPKDNVVVARKDVAIGTWIESEGIKSRSQVPAGHKIAARDTTEGEAILKYNVVIGFAASDIRAGTYVHSHNVSFQEFDRDYAHSQEYVPTTVLPERERATFEGYVRASGEVGTRNYIGILSTVNCSATVVHKVAEVFRGERLADFPHIDGVVGLSHGTGCGMEMSGEPMPLLRRTIAGYARNPNFAAVLVVGLGCERNQLAGLMEQEQLERGATLQTFIMQEQGGTHKTIQAAIEAVQAMLPAANQARRTTVPASHLRIGLQCGGSDGFSSITANPALGAAMDILVRHGATAARRHGDFVGNTRNLWR